MPGPKFAGFTVTIRLFGVLPLFGVTESQVNPIGLVAAVAVKGSGVFGSVLVTEIVCVVAAAPTIALILIDDWLTLSSGVVLTFKVTGMTSGGVLEPGTVRVIFPLHACGVRPETLTEATT